MKKKLFIILIIILSLFLTLEACGYYFSKRNTLLTNDQTNINSSNSVEDIQAKNATLKKRISNLSPKGIYLVVDTARNRIYVKKGDDVMKEIIVSTGSGSVLKDPSGKREWVFDTPRGERHIHGKITNPVWTKPDWAFIEDGEEIPKDNKGRVEAGVLGDYAMSLGDGYLIHGTLYKRLLGRSVTHGCIRVGDEDLKDLYNTVQVGTKVMIF